MKIMGGLKFKKKIVDLVLHITTCSQITWNIILTNFDVANIKLKIKKVEQSWLVIYSKQCSF